MRPRGYLRQPSIAASAIAFVCDDDVWLMHAGQLGFDSCVRRNVTASASLAAQRQKSNLPDNDPRSAILRLGASLMF